jgi:4-hydroxybenzoate polyprenyltransferase
LLLLWPTLWALWLASQGYPHTKILVIFVLGVFLMRSAGCVMNDFADRHFDGRVERTRHRPLATGQVTVFEALIIAAFLSLSAFFLVLQCNQLTIYLSFVGAGLAFLYPFLKRVTHLPQIGLGMAFTWGVPMAFAAETGAVTTSAWFLFFTGMLWPVIYDTMYAMVDRDDDVKIGVKSTAILFDVMDKLIVGLIQILFVIFLVITALMFELHEIFYVCIAIVAALFIYQQWLIKDRDSQKCFKAFMNNNWVGLVIFTGIVLSYLK